MSDTPADPPKPPRVLPRAARLSRLNPAVDGSPAAGDTAAPVPPPAPAREAVAAPPPPPPAEPAVARQPPAQPAPQPAVSPPAPPAAAPAEVTPAPPKLAPAPPAPVLQQPPASAGRDVLDLAQAIARSTPPADKPSAEPRTVTSPGDSTSALRSVPTTSYAPAPGQAKGPVTFKPLVDPWANRSVIVSSFGLVLCFLPVLALAGLVLGVLSLRRIAGSGGSLTGARTARFGVWLGAAGLAIGIAADVWFLATQ